MLMMGCVSRVTVTFQAAVQVGNARLDCVPLGSCRACLPYPFASLT